MPRVSSFAVKADDRVGSLTAGSLAQLETVETATYTIVNHASQKGTTSERSVSTSSSSGIVSDDVLSASPSPYKRRPKAVMLSPESDIPPDAPTGVCVTEEDGLLVVQWNPVR